MKVYHLYIYIYTYILYNTHTYYTNHTLNSRTILSAHITLPSNPPYYTPYYTRPINQRDPAPPFKNAPKFDRKVD